MAIWKYLRYDIYPKRTGFICQDPNLSYPYRNSTIADKWLFIIGFGVPILVWILEFFLTKSSDLKKKFKKSSFLAWKWIFYFAYIIFSMDCLIEIIKNFAGVHRPYFFDVCNPDLAVNCTKGTYVNSDYECQNKNLQKMLLSHSEKSFPSGHASSTTFSCLYFMWYIHMRLSKSKILRSFVNLICLIWIAVCCTSRVTDYWHRAIDIIAGIIIAIPFAFYLVSRNSKKIDELN